MLKHFELVKQISEEIISLKQEKQYLEVENKIFRKQITEQNAN